MDRKNIIISALSATFMMSMSATAQKAQWASADDPVAKELIAKEKMWGESNCSPQPGLKEVFAEEFQGTAPDGTRYGKAQAMETDLNNLDRQCQLGEVKIQFFGKMVAVAFGNESSIRKSKDGKEFLRCLVWTNTWLKRDGKWQIITAQDVIVECSQ
jgi:transcription elongation GreA/GreB family factor